MDTTTETALSKAHENLAEDLANCSQLIDPLNSQALAMLFRSQRRLEDIQECAKHPPLAGVICEAMKTFTPETGPKGFVGALPEDTLSHVSDVLVVLENIDYNDCGSSDEFSCGMLQILSNAVDALDYEKERVSALRKRP